MKKVKSIFKNFGLVFCIWCLLGSAANAGPTVVNIGIQATEELLIIDGVLVDAFNEKMLEAIDSGVPITLNFHIELRKKVSIFGDTLIGSNTILNTVQYDSLKKIYRYSSSGKSITRKVDTHSRNHSQQLMVTLKDIPIAPLYKLEPDEKYYVRIKAELEADEFLFPFNYLLFFVPFDGFETSWSESSLLSINSGFSMSQEASGTGQGKKAKESSRTMKNVVRSFHQ